MNINLKKKKNNFHFYYQFKLISYLVCFFLKKFFVGQKKEKVFLFSNKNFKFSESILFLFRKVFLYKKFFYFFLLKSHLKNLHFDLKKSSFVSHKNIHSGVFGSYCIPSVKDQSFFFDSNSNVNDFFRIQIQRHMISDSTNLDSYSSTITGDCDFFYLTLKNVSTFYIELLLVRFFFLNLRFISQREAFFIPTRSKLFTVLKSPHKYSKSREQFGFNVRKTGFFSDNFLRFFPNGFLIDGKPVKEQKKIKIYRCDVH
jgi:hypothetical protein